MNPFHLYTLKMVSVHTAQNIPHLIWNCARNVVSRLLCPLGHDLMGNRSRSSNPRFRVLASQPTRVLLHVFFQFGELEQKQLGPLVDVRRDLVAGIQAHSRRVGMLELCVEIR